MRIPRLGARAGRATVGVLLLATTFLALPTGPATGDPEVDPQSATKSNVKAPIPELKALIADDPAAGLPGFSDLPTPRSISITEGTVTASQNAVARRSKMSITARPIWAAMYYGEFNNPIENPTGYVGPSCVRKVACLPDPFYQPSCATEDPSTQWPTSYFRHPMYPIKPIEGGGAEVGIVTEDKVNLVAFGTIPATATLTISVPPVGGKVQPLMVHLWSRPAAASGCAPRPSDIPGASALVNGKVFIQLSDLEVDGVPVDLGPRCRTKHPAELYLWGDFARGSYNANNGGPLGAYDGLHPGSRGPLNSPYYRNDNGRTIPPSTGIDIPSFANCGTNGDDLSPLVSAMASGPNNPVRATQGQINAFNRVPLEDLSMCSGSPARPSCPLPGPEVPERPPLPDGEGE
ncbi:hypothetical protein OG801_07085 [Nocardioides sp. NBC_00163]|uniref:hypothetical protein n=1 Tax=unclassified Nocardioides TaxID=2615069 RepID=UPI003248A3E5